MTPKAHGDGLCILETKHSTWKAPPIAGPTAHGDRSPGGGMGRTRSLDDVREAPSMALQGTVGGLDRLQTSVSAWAPTRWA